MRPYYDVRVEDLSGGDYVLVECTCGHTQLLTRSMLDRYGLRPSDPGSTPPLSGLQRARAGDDQHQVGETSLHANSLFSGM